MFWEDFYGFKYTYIFSLYLSDIYIRQNIYFPTKENIKTVIETGVDYISSGALTHSAPILDVSLKNLCIL